MKILKIIGLGTFLFLVISIGVGAASGTMRHSSAAVGLSAMRAGMLETLFNPYFWLTIIVAYGAAFWIVRRQPR